MIIKNKLNNKKIGGKALIPNKINSNMILNQLVKQGYISNKNIEEVTLKLYNKLPNRNYTNINVPLFVKELVCAYKSGKNVESKCKKILEKFNEDKIFDDDFRDFIENYFNDETIISCGTNNDKGNATIFYKALYEMKRHAEGQITKENKSSSKFGSTVSFIVKSVAKRKNISIYEERIKKIVLIYQIQSKFLNSFMNLKPINRPKNIGLNFYTPIKYNNKIITFLKTSSGESVKKENYNKNKHGTIIEEYIEEINNYNNNKNNNIYYRTNSGKLVKKEEYNKNKNGIITEIHKKKNNNNSNYGNTNRNSFSNSKNK